MFIVNSTTEKNLKNNVVLTSPSQTQSKGIHFFWSLHWNWISVSHCNSGLDFQKSPKLEKLGKDDPSGEYPQFSSSLPSTQSNVPTNYNLGLVLKIKIIMNLAKKSIFRKMAIVFNKKNLDGIG